jgi:hypothetical protein
MPSPRFFPPRLGMNTRLTGSGFHDPGPRCTRSASCAFCWSSSTIRPSMPAVLRPALISVTRRTLTIAFARDRSISFCRLRTRFRSPACDAAKIRCLSRRTSPSARRQSTLRQPGIPSSGPFTMPIPHASACTCIATASNLPFGSGGLRSSVSAGPPGSRQHPSGSGHQPGIRPVIQGQRQKGAARVDPGFPLPFGCRPSLFEPSCARPGVAPSSRSAYRAPGARTRTGLSRSARTSCDRKGCPLNPGDDGAPAAATQIAGRRLPHRNGMSLHPGTTCHHPGLNVTRHQQGFTGVHPPGLPLTCNPRMARGSLGFPRSSAPRRYQQRTSGQGQA